MLPSFRDQGPGQGHHRRRRSYSHGSIYGVGVHKAARTASKLSLQSVFTVQSNGSNGSNSTVTQESYNKASRKRKPSSVAKRKKDEGRPRPVMDAVEEIAADSVVDGDEVCHVDVFDFLVGDEENIVEAQHTTEEAKALAHDDEEGEEEDEEPQPVPYPVCERDFNSDSGISMDDTSLFQDKIFSHRPIPVTFEDQHKDLQSDPNTTGPLYPPVPRPSYRAPMGVDRAYRDTAANADRQFEVYTADRSQQDQWTSPPSVFTDEGISSPLASDALAAKYADMDCPPLFKAFRKTNYRLLLHLQGEIIELEDELARLDVFAKHRRPSNGTTTDGYPVDQRWIWPQQHFDSHRAKTDLLDRLQTRMEQYYKVVNQVNTFSTLTSAAAVSSEEVTRFRKVINDHLGSTTYSPHGKEPSTIPTSLSQLKFLDDTTDLLRAGPHRPHNTPIPDLLFMALDSILLMFVLISGGGAMLLFRLLCPSLGRTCLVPTLAATAISTFILRMALFAWQSKMQVKTSQGASLWDCPWFRGEGTWAPGALVVVGLLTWWTAPR